ncbi:hypothetical protein [Enterococcus sp.]|uniref:hypothetical protein n=1 Tax=Enterococcus sp. TaxID=35783 RepID=UPI003996C4B8
MPEANKGYFSGGSMYIGPVLEPVPLVQLHDSSKVSKTSKGTTFELEPARPATNRMLQPFV